MMREFLEQTARSRVPGVAEKTRVESIRSERSKAYHAGTPVAVSRVLEVLEDTRIFHAQLRWAEAVASHPSV